MNGSELLVVAEGDDACATLLCEQLAADGATRSTGRAATTFSLCALRAPAALIAGELPGNQTAVSLVRAIRSGETAGQRVGPDPPALLLSADRSQLGALRAFDAGADDVVARRFAYGTGRRGGGGVMPTQRVRPQPLAPRPVVGAGLRGDEADLFRRHRRAVLRHVRRYRREAIEAWVAEIEAGGSARRRGLRLA